MNSLCSTKDYLEEINNPKDESMVRLSEHIEKAIKTQQNAS